MDNWKRSFLEKLSQAQGQWASQFENTLDQHFLPAFNEHKAFLSDNGFRLSIPMRESGQRSFKFELSENAYMLMIFRSSGVGEFELRSESFVPGNEPVLEKAVFRVADLNNEWVLKLLHTALDAFVDLLAGQETESLETLEPELIEA
ncbi:MAG: hypothetical protein ABIG44_06840 [Planctomycetota bacterium]